MRKIICTTIVFSLLSSFYANGQNNSIITLDQCIEAAVRYNPVIKEAESELNIASSEVRIAQSGLYPVIATELSGGYSDEYRLNNNYRTGTGTISAEQVLWQKGRIKESIERARYSLQADVNSLAARKLDIIIAVKNVYLNCLMQSQLFKAASENVSNASLFLEYAREKFRIGAGRKSDVLKAESDLSEAQYEKDVFLNSLSTSQNDLGMLTGLPPAGFSELENFYSSNKKYDFEEDFDTLLAKASRNYPELMQVNNMQLAQQAAIREVKAERYPELSLNAGYNWSYNPALPGQRGWLTAMTMRWQLFNGSKNLARIEGEKSRESVYVNRKNELKDFLKKEISNRLINLREAISQIKLTEKLLLTTSENLEIARAQYKAGTGSMLELTTARNDALDASKKNIKAITDFRLALINLERLTENKNQY